MGLRKYVNTDIYILDSGPVYSKVVKSKDKKLVQVEQEKVQSCWASIKKQMLKFEILIADILSPRLLFYLLT